MQNAHHKHHCGKSGGSNGCPPRKAPFGALDPSLGRTNVCGQVDTLLPSLQAIFSPLCSSLAVAPLFQENAKHLVETLFLASWAPGA